jgi:hypothetical protein
MVAAQACGRVDGGQERRPFFLVTEHRAHLFHHHGHGGHRHSGGSDRRPRNGPEGDWSR